MIEIRAYYNEIDPAACAILRQLIADGVIAPGDVDSRSIKEVTAGDLRGYTQCHFFAGGGLWSVAARMAGWPDARPLWTASCPCQPISAAGKRLGADDPRHLWPDLYRIFRAARNAGFAPPVLVGEQVAGSLGYNWFDGVRADLAAEEVAARTVDFPAGAVDAPQQRNRLYWIAVADAERVSGRAGLCEGGSIVDRAVAADGHGGDGTLVHPSIDGRGEGRAEAGIQRGRPAASGADVRGEHGAVGDTERAGLERHARDGDGSGRTTAHRPVAETDVAEAAGDMGDANGSRQFQRERHEPGQWGWPGDADARRGLGHDDSQATGRDSRAISRAQTEGPGEGRVARREPDGPWHANGRNGTHWSSAEWIICHDKKARRAEPGLRLLVNGLPGRVDLWRVGGNAIVPQAAAEVLAAFLEAEAGMRAAA